MLKKSVIPIILLFFIGWAGFSVWQMIWYRSLIPQKIETHWWPVAIDGKIGLMYACGAAIFEMKASTAKAIDTQGLDFFENPEEVQASGLFRTKKHYYSNWKETPLGLGKLTDGGYADIVGCNSSLSPIEKRAIAHAAFEKGGYYPRGSENARLLVLPSLKLVLFTYGK